MPDSLPAPAATLRFGDLRATQAPFTAIAMFTPSHVSTAERLLTSLRKWSVPHALFEVPTVHRSISPKGSDDLAYTKASLIHHILEQTGRPVLYLDSDTVVRRSPSLIHALARKCCDFAIFNWLAVDSNDAYVPLSTEPPKPGQPDFRTFYAYSHAIGYVAQDQLICSGAAQFWGASAAAKQLLCGWQQTIAAQPGVPDDVCLDFTFNNQIGGWAGTLTTSWLPKSYARYSWWIFDEPYIDHPDIPYSGASLPSIQDPAGRQRAYWDRASLRTPSGPIPRDCIIDTTTGNLYRLKDNQLTPVGRCSRRMWVSPKA